MWGAGAALVLLMTQAAAAQSLSSEDRKFMEDAAKGGMMEVHMGQMGLKHGDSSGVKSFSQRLIDDHSKGNRELQALAQKKGVTLPVDNPSDMPKGLEAKSGAAFDREFAANAVEDHQKDIKEFEQEAKSGSDPDVKNWATKTLPTLQAHLDAARALNK
jgi:putative membrane protein